MFYRNSQFCAFNLAIATETYDLQNWKFPLPDSQEASAIERVERNIRRKRQRQIIRRNTNLNKFSAVQAAERLHQIRDDSEIARDFKNIRDLDQSSPNSSNKEKRRCLKGARRVRFALDENRSDTTGMNSKFTVRFHPEVSYIPDRKIRPVAPLLSWVFPNDWPKRPKLDRNLLRTLHSPCVLAVIGRRIEMLERSLGDDEMLERRLRQANAIAGTRLINKKEREHKLASHQAIDPMVEGIYLQMWEEKVDARVKKCTWDEVVRVREVSYISYKASDNQSERSDFISEQQKPNLEEKLGEFEIPLKKKSEHRPMSTRTVKALKKR